MLKTAKQTIPIEPKKGVLMVQKRKNVFQKKGKSQKQVNQGKGKEVVKTKVKSRATLDQTCFYCNKKGHWKQNFPKYLQDMKDGNIASTSGIYVIQINLGFSYSWVLDTDCDSHICGNVQ